MKKMMQLALGLVTSIGGFLEIGSVTTAAQAGASFGFQPLWALALGTVCLIFLVEMSGRLSAVSKQTLVDALRTRFGFRFYMIVLAALAIVSFLVLTAELGGIALSLQILTGFGFPKWVVPVCFFVWVLLWKADFSIIENGASILGLVTISFVVAAIKLHPRWGAVAGGLVPSVPPDDRAKYGFIAVSILGASISPYLMYFYSSGAIEEEWDESYLGINRFIAGFGMLFGGLLSMAVLIAAALAFRPAGIDIEKFEQAALLMEHGETWEDRGEKGWRRVVASPEPREILDASAVRALVDAGFVVMANGGGGIPVVLDTAGLHGVEAVIDKDLGAALLALTVDADVLLVVTDVPHAVLRFGSPDAEPLGQVDVRRLRALATEGHFASGSMGPKVEAACRFVEQGGTRAVISTLDHILDAVAGETGTVVVPRG